jgi:erythronate-4-phosphate dehydrogenase
MSSLHILADENIPCVEEAFGELGSIECCAGREMGPAEVADADVLLVRSVTAVGAPLLEDSAVRFVGSATIGTDHVDRDYLTDRGIAFAHAPASNADSVADYVVAALLAVARDRGEHLRGRTVGVVGCGNVGSRVARRLSALGLSVLRNDPPLAADAEAAGQAHPFVSLATVLAEADVVTLHVPLTTDGPHPTRHLIDAAALSRMQEVTWLVNTSRGPVVDGDALLASIEAGRVGATVLDVWEGEPSPSPDLVRAVDVATPHIAGYAYDGKVRGTTMLYEALCDVLDVEPRWDPSAVLQPDDPDALHCHPPAPRLPQTAWLHHLARQAYDLAADDARMRQILDHPRADQGDYFSHLRATYPTRREMQQHAIRRAGIPDAYRAAVTDGLTMQCR